MSDIYLRQQGRLLAMRERPYEAETVLQELLADHPELLASDGSRLVLVRREAKLSDRSERLYAGSLDHLFLDHRAVPTLVEVKRSSDARLRRDVVGQMLDYAANAASCWPDETLRTWFSDSCAPADPTDALQAAFPDVEDPEEYWTDVQTNLRAGRMRLVFVADAIPPHLRRIIEFLNAQLRYADVIAVEVKQYVDERGEVQTLVPRVVGQTEASRLAKAEATSEQWSHTRILDAMRERHPPEIVGVTEALFAWARELGLREWFGSGARDGSYQAGVEQGGRYLCPFALYTYGRVEIHFQYLARRPPFSELALRQELRARLNEIPGVAVDESDLEVRPSFPLELLVEPAALERFLAAMAWALAQFPSVAEQ
jgi:hypothetical protein